MVAPWVVRNKVQVGCYAITTDARALWKANNPNTYAVLDRGGWIDDVPELPGAPPWPELAADLTLAGKPTSVDECAQMRLYRGRGDRLLARASGREGASRAAGDPDAVEPGAARVRRSGSGTARAARRTIEPAFMVALYVLAVAGVFVAPPYFVVLALLLLAYNTLAAMVFAGTARYRVPWDFLLALLAAFALAVSLGADPAAAHRPTSAPDRERARRAARLARRSAPA